jgi:Ulp1 family protease
VNVDGNHWIFCVVDVVKRDITYDSLAAYHSDVMDNLLKWFSLAARDHSKEYTSKWTRSNPQKTTDGYECGVWTVMGMDAVMKGRAVHQCYKLEMHHTLKAVTRSAGKTVCSGAGSVGPELGFRPPRLRRPYGI